MTWQRIDENIYIDDSLVTCAEYQLFIDEMCELRKYFQPDQWNSYQFPEGQAQQPILGVRHSDAESFCGWLTQHETRNWLYRLPNTVEANQHALKLIKPLPSGYWINDAHNEFDFIWVTKITANAKSLHFDRTLKLAYDLALSLDLKIILNNKFDISHSSDLDVILKFDSKRAKDRELVRDLANHLAHIRDLSRSRDFLDTYNIFLHDGNLDMAYDIYSRTELDHARDVATDLFEDISVLLERIAGRSPAFEGIRLAKERK